MYSSEYDIDDEDLSIKNGDQYFLFLSGDDLFAIDALRVLEIVEYQEIIKVPKMRSCVKGVTNIRGDIMAVIDLQDRLERTTNEVTPKTSMIILEVEGIQMALIIDEVFEVDNIDDLHIKRSPAFGTKVDRKFIKNMAQYGNDYIPILNIEAILNVKELQIYKGDT